jgi:hypothetical protein
MTEPTAYDPDFIAWVTNDYPELLNGYRRDCPVAVETVALMHAAWYAGWCDASERFNDWG